jgi:hypothetical protein
VCELFQSLAEGKALGERQTASLMCLIGSTVNAIQKQRSIHNHRGSLAVTGNSLWPLTRLQPSRPSVCEGFQTRAREKLRKS